MHKHFNKIIITTLFIGIFINIFFSYQNLKNYDGYRGTSDGNLEHYMIRSDVYNGWTRADEFKKNLEDNEKFLSSFPVYDRSFLSNIFIGTYFFLTNQDIFEDKYINENQKKVKIENNKIGFLIFQIIIFYVSLFYLSKKLKKLFSKKNIIFIILLLSFEPTILQWHSSFWSESIYLTFLIILLGKLTNIENKLAKSLFVGILIGIMYAQRAASFLLIIPILIYYSICFRNNFKPFFLLIFGYLIILFGIGYNHLIKTDKFFILPYQSHLYSNYHYMLHEMKSKSEKKPLKQALKQKIDKENQWLLKNNINKNDFNDIFLIINYRNSEFFSEVFKNPFNSFFYLLNKISQAAILDPFWVNKNLHLDKSKKDYVKSLNKDLLPRIFYSLIFYLVSFAGLIPILKNFFSKKKLTKLNSFMFLNLMFIAYFFIWTGGYGVSRYFVPTIISFSFFFIQF